MSTAVIANAPVRRDAVGSAQVAPELTVGQMGAAVGSFQLALDGHFGAGRTDRPWPALPITVTERV